MTEPSRPDFSGSLAQYEIVRLLGEGGMASVWCARQVSLGRDVAIKILKNVEATDVERFVREGRLLATLVHPNIVRVLDAGTTGAMPYLVCELVEGRGLDQLLASGPPVPQAEAIGYVVQLAEALAFAHRHGIVHRDVKPANALITRAGEVKLSDFGLARTISKGGTLTSAGILLGTPAYLAPELLGEGPLTPASDQYSLAVTAYELLSGELPFLGDEPSRQLAARLSGAPRQLATVAPHVSREIARIVMRGLSSDPAQRHPSVDAFGKALEAAARSTESPDLSRTLAAPRPDLHLPAGAGPARGTARVARAGEPRDRPGAGRRSTVDPSRFRLAGALAAGAVAVLAVVLLLARPSRPGLRLDRAEFPSYRVVEIPYSGPLPSEAKVLVTVPGHGSRAARIDPATGRLVVEDALPEHEHEVRVVDGAGEVRAAIGLRTPPVVTVSDLLCAAGVDQVLVDCTPSRRARLRLTIRSSLSRTGTPAVVRDVVDHHESPPESRFTHHIFQRLQPDTDYLLEVAVVGGWGGLEAYPFRTRPAGHRSMLRHALEARDDSAFITSGTDLWGDPDVDAVPVLRDLCAHPDARRPIENAWSFCVAAAALRDLPLTRLTAARFAKDTGDPGAVHHLLRACAASRDLDDAGELVKKVGPAIATDQNLVDWARVLSLTGGPARCDEIAARVEKCLSGIPVEVSHAMIECDESRGRAHFARWLEMEPESPVLVVLAARGLERLGSDEDVRILAGAVARRASSQARVHAIDALARLGNEEARSVISTALAGRAGSQPLIWAGVRLGLEGVRASIDRLRGDAADVDRRLASRVLDSRPARTTPRSLEFSLDPSLPWFRTGLRLRPGRCIEVTACGKWGPRGAEPFFSCVPTVLPGPPAFEMQLTALVGRGVHPIRKCDSPVPIVTVDEGELLFTPYPSRIHKPGPVRSVAMTGNARVVVSW